MHARQQICNDESRGIRVRLNKSVERVVISVLASFMEIPTYWSEANKVNIIYLIKLLPIFDYTKRQETING